MIKILAQGPVFLIFSFNRWKVQRSLQWRVFKSSFETKLLKWYFLICWLIKDIIKVCYRYLRLFHLAYKYPDKIFLILDHLQKLLCWYFIQLLIRHIEIDNALKLFLLKRLIFFHLLHVPDKHFLHLSDIIKSFFPISLPS